jgi:hypothetical protein
MYGVDRPCTGLGRGWLVDGPALCYRADSGGEIACLGPVRSSLAVTAGRP